MPIKEDEVSYTYDASKLLEDVPKDDREDATYEAGEAALQKIHEYMGKQVSPVSGEGKYRALNKKSGYRKLKQKMVGNKKANLRLTGSLIESMEVDANDSSFTISVSSDEAAKAYNHNEGDTLPKRQFLPNDEATDKNSRLKRDVVKVIKEAINRYKKPIKKRPAEAVAPLEVTTEAYSNLYESFKATKREQEIAKNVLSFKIEDIL